MKNRHHDNNPLVYSTNKDESQCPNCGESRKFCSCKPAKRSAFGDDIIRVRREVKGRKGKTVTTISGLPSANIDTMASELKRYCGTGGSAKEGLIVIQGDHRQKIVPWLEKKGFHVKLAGG